MSVFGNTRKINMVVGERYKGVKEHPKQSGPKWGVN